MANTAKTAIVTGASHGIEAGLVDAFLQRGYSVVANSRHITKTNPFAYLVKASDNAEGVDDVTGGTLVSDCVPEDNWNGAAGASPTGTLQCVGSWLEDLGRTSRETPVPP